MTWSDETMRVNCATEPDVIPRADCEDAVLFFSGEI